ncbi:MAG: hypothetical protein ACI9R3_001236 [Verrucomicrobiales bacterium]|jgi:hypothetical protein
MYRTDWITRLSHSGTTCAAALLICVLAPLTTGCADNKGNSSVKAKSRPVVVDAVVLSSPELPSPETAPYRDCLFTVRCKVERSISGDAPANENFLATTWAFRDRIAQPGQELTKGALIRLTLESLDLEAMGLATTMRIDESDTFDKPEFWVQSMAVVKPGAHVHVEPPVFGVPLEELAPLNRKLVERGEGFTIGQDGFFFGMPTREIYRKDFWKLPLESDFAPGAAEVVLDFHRQLEAKGIPLVFVVVPRASTIFPDIETGLPYDWESNGAVNAPVEDWCQELRGKGVHVVNLTAPFLANRFTEASDGKSYPVYLQNDSHWGPSGAQLAANVVTDYIRSNKLLPDSALTIAPTAAELPITHTGDLAELMIANGITELARDTVAYQVQPAPVQDGVHVQLLGDSLTRIFDVNRSSFGDHLQARIGANWDIIAPNGGVTTARKIFSRKSDLDSIDLVIWEIAEEFIALHKMWRLVPLNTDDTLQFWRDALVSEAAQESADKSKATTFEEPGDWDDLVGIRSTAAARLTWNVVTEEGAQFTTRIRVGPTDAGVSRRASVMFRVLADGKELYHAGLVPRRDRHVMSEPITIPLPKSESIQFTLVTEVAEGTAPPWIDWVSPEIDNAKLRGN